MSARVRALPNPLFDIDYKPQVIQRVFDYYESTGLIRLTEVYKSGVRAVSWLKAKGHCGRLKEKIRIKRLRKRRKTLSTMSRKPNKLKKGKHVRKSNAR